MNNIWLTSDLHFFHKKIMEYNSNTRPWANLEDMHNGIIEHINSKVSKGDTIYHLGDFSFSKKPEDTANIINRINCNLCLIKGNHCYSKHWNKVLPLVGNKVVWLKDYHELKYEGTKSPVNSL